MSRARFELIGIAMIMGLGCAFPAQALELDLLCSGVGTAPDAETSTFSAHGMNTGPISGHGTTFTTDQFTTTVRLEIVESQGRIRLPERIVPPINGGGRDGWWRMNALAIDDDDITARFRLNFLNKPKVRLDRVTGELEIDGSFGLSFRGTCSVIDPAQRKF